MENEKIIKPSSGWMTLFIVLVLFIVSGLNFVMHFFPIPLTGFVIFAGFFLMTGLMSIEPNSSRVLTFFGKYVGAIKDNGFFFVNPLYTKRKITLRARNLETTQLKVNDKQGNPVMIGAILVWKVEDPYKAAFDVENYEQFVAIQTESALRKLAMGYSYDNFEDEKAEITLRSSSNEINNMLESEISERLSLAGIKVIEARISHLSYSAEIASAMLQRQQAIAVVAARSKIVEGAVGMVQMALDALSEKKIVNLSEEKKATMVSNLLVVLCSDKGASPVVNTSSE